MNTQRSILFCLLIIPSVCCAQVLRHTLSGTVSDARTGEIMQGATIAAGQGKESTVSNAYGYFSLVLPAAEDTITVTRAGSASVVFAADLRQHDVFGKVAMQPAAKELEAVSVTGERTALRRNVQSTQMGMVDLPVSLLVKVPSIAGEPDIIKALQLTPGVKRGGEGTIGMYIRGGGADENLVLLDEATVYNAGHLLGFFSVFNTSALKEVQLYKSSFPAQYSGRLSGVLDVRMKEGNMKEFEGDAGIGIISSNITLQGPLVKDRTSFIISGRRTYLDAITGNDIPYHFYDVNAKLNHIIDARNRIFFSFYKGDDVLNITGSNQSDNVGASSSDLRTGLKLGNGIGSLRWSHITRNKKAFANFSIIYTRFRYNITGQVGNNSLLIASSVRDIGAKTDISFKKNQKHSLTFGGQYIVHYFTPDIVNTTGSLSDAIRSSAGQQIYNLESGIYGTDEWKATDKLLVNIGVRLTADAVENKTYFFPEPRISGRYLISKRSSVKVSYSAMAQSMHLVSSSSIALPTDLWYPATRSIHPGTSNQLSLGWYRNIGKRNLAVSVEAYYKWLHHLIEYKEGASLILNDNYEKELVQGRGRTYGIELFVTKTAGRWQGWAGYALSYAHRTFDSLNAGKEYFTRFDRRHDLSFVVAYHLSGRWNFAGTYVFSTGSPFTAQVSQFIAPSPSFTNIDVLPVYSSRNAVRLSGSQRIDLDFTCKFHQHRKVRSELHLGCYNLLNAVQPGRVTRDFNEATGTFEYHQKGLFGFIPSIAYNIHF